MTGPGLVGGAGGDGETADEVVWTMCAAAADAALGDREGTRGEFEPQMAVGR